MSSKNVIVYFLHEDEEAEASSRMTQSESTESFIIGRIEDADINALRQRGMIVQELDVSDEPEVNEAVAAAASRNKVLRNAEPLNFDFTVPNYYRVTLRGPLLETWRNDLDSAGVRLQESVAPNAYLCLLGSTEASNLNAMEFVASVRPLAERDVNPLVATHSAPPVGAAGTQMSIYDVRLHSAEGMASVMDWLRSQGVYIAGRSRRKVRVFLMNNSDQITTLATLPEVRSVEEYIEPKLTNDRARELTNIDNPTAALPQTGAGQIVGIADTGLDDLHPDFQGRIAGLEALGRVGDSSDPNGHGTHVAGTVLGDGSSSAGQYPGMAPHAQLYFQSIMDAHGRLGGLPVDLNDLFDQAYQQGVRIHNNSWGADTSSRYTVNSIEVDEFVADNPDMLIVISAGNEGVGSGTPNSPGNAQTGFVDWLSIGSPGSAKNALTVGASRSDRTTGGYAGLTWSQAWPGDFPDSPIADENTSGDREAMAAFSSRGPGSVTNSVF